MSAAAPASHGAFPLARTRGLRAVTDQTASARAERVLAVAAAVSRLAAMCLLLAGIFAVTTGGGPKGARESTIAICGLVLAESTVTIALHWRARIVRAWVAALDACCVAMALALTSAGLGGGGPGESPVYNFAVIGFIAVGLAAWPLWASLACGTLFGVANMASVAAGGAASYPVRHVIGDSLTFLGSAVLTWTIATLVRHAARRVDEQSRAAVTRAAELASERERARHAKALSKRILSTLDLVVAAEGLLAPALHAHVRAEADWLRGHLVNGLVDEADLLPALRALAAEKAPAGLEIRFDLPDVAPPIAPDCVVALIGAARESLTNVVRHAGTPQADLTVLVETAGVVVEVADSGRGYDTETGAGVGVGQRQSIRQRMADCGGEAVIDSVPGQGTRVRLWAPIAGGG